MLSHYNIDVAFAAHWDQIHLSPIRSFLDQRRDHPKACKNYKSRIGGDGNGNDGEPETWKCLSEVEHKVRATYKTLMVEADPGKYKSSSSIRFPKIPKEDGTPIDEVVNLLPAALKANGYTV